MEFAGSRLWCVYGASTAFKPIKGNSLLCNLLPLVWRRGQDSLTFVSCILVRSRGAAAHIQKNYLYEYQSVTLCTFAYFYRFLATVPISSRYASVVIC